MISDIQARSSRRAEYRDQREDEDFDPRLTPGLGVEKGSVYRRMTNKALIAAADNGDKAAQAEIDRRAERRSQKHQDKPRSNPGYSEVRMLRLPRANSFRRNPNDLREFYSFVDWDSYTQTMGMTTWWCSEEDYALLEPYLTDLLDHEPYLTELPYDGAKQLDWDLIVKQFHLHDIPVVVKEDGQIVRTSTLGKEMRGFV